MVFLMILFLAAGMDLKTKTLDSRFLVISGIVGTIVGWCGGFHGRDWKEILLSCGIGVMILIVSRLTNGGIGEGDGWFFMISGLFLDVQKNSMLFLSGIFASGIFGLILAAASFWKGEIRGKSFPFLPFLIPGGIWAVCFVK